MAAVWIVRKYMNEVYEKKLHESVCNFKKWAQRNYPEWSEENDSGEWEPRSAEFGEMIYNIIEIIENTSCSSATKQMTDDILFGIARDDECGMIMAKLSAYPEWYSFLCKRCPETGYINAKWQFAASLKDYSGDDDLRETVFRFLEAGGEYTERMALMSLAHIYPDKAEKYAIDFWEKNKFGDNEYRKMMVLDVLCKIRSPKAEHYLELAVRSEHKRLRENAEKIREKY